MGEKKRYCTVPLVELVIWTEPTKQSSCFVELIQCLAPHGDVKLLFILALGFMFMEKVGVRFFNWWSWGENVTTKRYYLPLKYLRFALKRTSWSCQGWCGYTAIHICPMPPVGQIQPLQQRCESEKRQPTVAWVQTHTHTDGHHACYVSCRCWIPLELRMAQFAGKANDRVGTCANKCSVDTSTSREHVWTVVYKEFKK